MELLSSKSYMVSKSHSDLCMKYIGFVDTHMHNIKLYSHTNFVRTAKGFGSNFHSGKGEFKFHRLMKSLNKILSNLHDTLLCYNLRMSEKMKEEMVVKIQHLMFSNTSYTLIVVFI